MSADYEPAFRGSRETAVSAMHKVQQQLLGLADKGNKDSNRRQMQLALSVLRSICSVATKPGGNHYDVYCDTLVNVLAKNIQPSVGAKYWTMYLEHVRYLHHILADKKLFNEAERLCGFVASLPYYLQSDGDYKVLLGMFLQHLLSQHNHMSVNASQAQEHIVRILDALKELFIRMQNCNKEYNFTYPELISDFVQYLVPKRVSTVFNYLATLPSSKTQMYDSFFSLLKELHAPQPTKEELQAHCQRHIEALTVFFQLDVSDRLQQQLALRHMRTCRDMSLFANDKSSNYVFSLLYYLVKLVYGLPNPGEFKDVYKDLSGKLTTFFDRYGEMLMQERWFTDVPVVIAVLLSHLQHHPTTPFAFFWQHMNNIECYISHYELILGCLRLAPRIAETKLLRIDCCTSARKHTIISLVVSGLAAYSSYALAVDDSTTESEKLFISLRTQLLLLIRHGVSVLDSLVCITPESAELKLIFCRFVQLTMDMRTPAQIRLCLTLAEFLLRIRHKFSIKDWTLMLRRLYKMSIKANDASLIADLHAAHISSMLQEGAWPDLSLLRTRIGHFHTASPHITAGQCILQLSLQSHSPFKVFLDSPQKHLLHWLETQQFLKYHKSNEQLQITLMQCSPTQYNEVLVARGVGTLQAAAAARLSQIKSELENKMHKTAGLTRLEQLCWAHVNTALLHDSLKLQKESRSVETKFQEDNLEVLLQRKELATVTVVNEVKLVKQAQTAVKGFEKFYEEADTEPIITNEVYIDWEAIVEDVTNLALYFQLSGYSDLATDAWALHYHITNMIDDTYNSLRSLSYFCEHSQYFITLERGIDLNEEVGQKQNFLFVAMQQLPTLPKRFQNYVLMSLCQLAHYYASKGHLSYSEILLEWVQKEHGELPNQQGKYNVVLGTVDVVKFRILWKHLGSSQCQKDVQLSQRSMLREMEGTLERFRGDFFKLSTSELMSYTLLLLSLIEQVAECAANRLCDHFVNSYFAGTFKLLLQSGSALRIIQMLAMWAWNNLQMEHVKKAQTKVKLIEYILGMKSLEYLRQMSEEAAVEKKLSAPVTYTALELLQSGMEPLRKMIPPHCTPNIKVKMELSPSTRGENSLNRFLRIQCNDTLREYEILQWCCFTVGCLNARLYFLADNHDNLQDFYETSQQWLDKHKQNTHLRISFQNIQLLCLQHYVNFLRSHKKYEKALAYLKAALANCTDMKGNVDTVYEIHFLLQLRATKIEMSLKKESINRAGLRRALTFNVSPDLDKPECENLVAVSVAPASARKKLTAPTFKIYGSNGNTPELTPKRIVTVASAVCKTKEKMVPSHSVSSVRKTRKRLVAENEQKTPMKAIASSTNSKSNIKSLTARKLREFRAAASDSQSSSSYSTPDTDTDNILNQCQRIESIDLSDIDDANKTQKDLPNSITKSNAKQQSALKARKLREDILNICQKIESIDLLEDDERTIIANQSGAPPTMPEEIKPNKSLVIDISDDIDDAPPKTKTSTTKNTAKKVPRTEQAKRKSKETKANNACAEMSTCATGETASVMSSEARVRVVEKIKITEDIKAITTKTKTRAKTEVRTLKVITKDTEIKVLSPSTKSTTKGKENAVTKNGSSSTTRGRPRTAARKASNKDNDANVAPPVTASRTLSKRARQ
ncbi:PREDICTED: protein three rows [Rhagoletis zephyria]|uniref:protein three rows n=1 Tax=Rhagoletis zephyria TaxID=28612 RepID=UPI00081125C6|nr:PREDICTED: protein three rows [Rhagoletis zephyria]